MLRSLAVPRSTRTRSATSIRSAFDHIVLDLTVDFEHRILEGTAVLELSSGNRVVRPMRRLVLDTRGLTIEEVGLRQTRRRRGTFTPTTFQLDPPDPILGSRLTIELEPTATQVRIAYHTSPSAGALQWLEPRAHGGQGQAVPVHPVAGDPCAVVDSPARFARRSRHLCGDDPRAPRAHRGDGGRVATPRRLTRARGCSILSCLSRSRRI